jgi:hypothetical protein
MYGVAGTGEEGCSRSDGFDVTCRWQLGAAVERHGRGGEQCSGAGPD